MIARIAILNLAIATSSLSAPEKSPNPRSQVEDALQISSGAAVDTLLAQPGKKYGMFKLTGSAGGGGSKRIRWTGSYKISVSEGVLGKLVAAIGREALAKIKAAGGIFQDPIAGFSSYTGKADGTACSDFTIDYTRGNLTGFLYVSSASFNETQGSISIVWYEHPHSEQDAGGKGE